jgi:glycine C-acetyltransferase
LEASTDLRARLWENATYFRSQISAHGFQLVPGEHAIIPVMLGDAKLARDFSERLLQRGVYAIGFSYPVVPHGKARIRTQMSAGHTREHLERAIEAFVKVGEELGVIGS